MPAHDGSVAAAAAQSWRWYAHDAGPAAADVVQDRLGDFEPDAQAL